MNFLSREFSKEMDQSLDYFNILTEKSGEKSSVNRVASFFHNPHFFCSFLSSGLFTANKDLRGTT